MTGAADAVFQDRAYFIREQIYGPKDGVHYAIKPRHIEAPLRLMVHTLPTENTSHGPGSH